MKTKKRPVALRLPGLRYRRADKHDAIRQNAWEFIQNFW
ncbi:hypothetical protein N643_17440 [Salmonella bongori serovar 48:z41:-- str. RKS3044]|uniref:Uncharacterized protein n=1 Tax=Salmonella bongori N268-08 TaxID=1197719 RepID=S5N2F1_SALBN|nr:hypothetical protein A464_4004 [Salmonella bongori N268-08]AID27655.1 hypothetical protein N643_17440 [Salmonella bongori serovar 48:z41:-- str. RKS3044]